MKHLIFSLMALLAFSAAPAAARQETSAAQTAASTIPASPAAWSKPQREMMIPVEGGRVWVRIDGDLASGAVPAIMIHGGPGGTHMTFGKLFGLADERPVIAYDQLGSGLSDRPDDPADFTNGGDVDRFVKAGQLGDEELPIAPHETGDTLCLPPRSIGVAIGGDDDIGLQVRYVGEWVADDNSGRQTPLGGLDLPTHLDGLAEAAGRGQQLVPPDQHGQRQSRRGGHDLAAGHPQEQARGALSGVALVGVGVGVEGYEGVGTADEAIGDDGVEIERDGDGSVAEKVADFFQNPALRIGLALPGHSPVKGDVGAVDAGRVRADKGADGLQ